ncbi:MAG: four helix bundle protein [Candidatus Moraniibacteriota bacterium]
MTNENKKVYDLEKRTIKLSEEIIAFLRGIKRDNINLPLISQLVRSATSVGANYFEANGASSKKDFRNKIYICKKESKESAYWIQLIAKANPDKEDECRKLWKEAHELTLIFSKIAATASKNEN